jgi:hypothetical protein
VPTGELILKIGEPDRYGTSKEWRDEPDMNANFECVFP